MEEEGFSVKILSKSNGLDVKKKRETSFNKVSIAIFSILAKEEALGFSVPAWLRLIPKTKEKEEKWTRL